MVWSGEAVSSYAHPSITSEPFHRSRDATTLLGSLKTCFGDGPIQGPSMVTDISDRTRVTWHDTITQRQRAQRTYAHASLPPSPSTPIAGRPPCSQRESPSDVQPVSPCVSVRDLPRLGGAFFVTLTKLASPWCTLEGTRQRCTVQY